MTSFAAKTENPLKDRRWWSLSFLLCGLGLVASGLMLSRYFALLEDRAVDSLNPCVAIGVGDCDAHLESAAAVVLGIPVAGWGLVWFMSLAWLLGAGLAIGSEFRAVAAIGGWLLSMGAVAAQLLLILLSLSRNVPACSVCLGVLVVNGMLPFVTKKCSGCRLREILQFLGRSVNFVLGRTEPNAANSWRALGFVSTLFVSSTLFQWVFVQTELRRGQADDPGQLVSVLAEFVESPIHPQLLDASGPRRGPAEAKAPFTVFSSFRCPACKALAEDLALLREEFGEEVSITFRHFPLYAHQYVADEGGDISDPVLTLAVAAEKQGRFWEYHDALYASGAAYDAATLQAIAAELELGGNVAEDAQLDTEVRALITRDIRNGLELGVDSTPTVFLNGRRVPQLDPHSLRMLVLHELDPSG